VPCVHGAFGRRQDPRKKFKAYISARDVETVSTGYDVQRDAEQGERLFFACCQVAEDGLT